MRVLCVLVQADRVEPDEEAEDGHELGRLVGKLVTIIIGFNGWWKGEELLSSRQIRPRCSKEQRLAMRRFWIAVRVPRRGSVARRRPG